MRYDKSSRLLSAAACVRRQGGGGRLLFPPPRRSLSVFCFQLVRRATFTPPPPSDQTEAARALFGKVSVFLQRSRRDASLLVRPPARLCSPSPPATVGIFVPFFFFLLHLSPRLSSRSPAVPDCLSTRLCIRQSPPSSSALKKIDFSSLPPSSSTSFSPKLKILPTPLSLRHRPPRFLIETSLGISGGNAERRSHINSVAQDTRHN